MRSDIDPLWFRVGKAAAENSSKKRWYREQCLVLQGRGIFVCLIVFAGGDYALFSTLFAHAARAAERGGNGELSIAGAWRVCAPAYRWRVQCAAVGAARLAEDCGDHPRGDERGGRPGSDAAGLAAVGIVGGAASAGRFAR